MATNRPRCGSWGPGAVWRQGPGRWRASRSRCCPGRGLDRRTFGPQPGGQQPWGAGGGVGGALPWPCVSFSKWRPAVVISLGGYASLGCVVAACLWRVPIVVVNVDAVPGAVNRLAARVAAASAVASPDVQLARAVLTGVPVRADMLAIDRSPEGRRAARRPVGPAEGRQSGSRLGRFARVAAHQPGHPRTGRVVGRPRRRCHPPRGRPAATGTEFQSVSRPRRGPHLSAGRVRRGHGRRSTVPPMSRAAGRRQHGGRAGLGRCPRRPGAVAWRAR